MVEILIVAVLVLWSTVVVFKKVFPKTANKTFGVLAEQTQKQGWNTVSKWLKPAPVAGCGGGCSCSQDDAPNANKNAEIQAVKWK